MSAPAGYTLLGVVGYSPKGDYDPTATYQRFDTVYYDGSTYYAKHDDLTDVTPAIGNDWGLMCQGEGEEPLGLSIVDGYICQTYGTV